MKSVRIALAVLAVVSAGAALAACGGAVSKADYSKKVQAALQSGDKDLKGVSFQNKADFDKAGKVLDSIADKVNGITPPANVKAEHKDFVKELHAVATDMTTLGPDVEAGLTDDGHGAGLALPDGSYWQFRSGSGEVTIEDSIWVDGQARPMPVQQLVLQGLVSRGGGNFSWMLKKRG